MTRAPGKVKRAKAMTKLPDPLATECPQCGKLGRALSHCSYCDEFIPITLRAPFRGSK